jgi:hypothetical protein
MYLSGICLRFLNGENERGFLGGVKRMKIFSAFRRRGLDLSSPSKFEESIVSSSDHLEELFEPNIWQEIDKKQNPRAYMEVIESLALSGNPKCQEFVSQFNAAICENSDDPEILKIALRKVVKFGELAAQSGMAREAVNIPVAMSVLAGILMDENGGYFTDEIKRLFKGAYRWSVLNSMNVQLSEEDQEAAAESAKELYESSSGFFDLGAEAQEEEEEKEEEEGKEETAPAWHGQQCAKDICDEVDDFEVIFQLVLEDIEGASMGNDEARNFARLSGIPPTQYLGSLKNSRPEVDGPKGVKTYLDEMALGYYPDLEKMAEFRIAATDYIMWRYGLGKYASGS